MRKHVGGTAPVVTGERVFFNPFPLPTIEQRVKEHLEDGTDTLYICPNAWALRHRFLNRETGEMIRARCNSWRCLYCGPRKVEQWRQVIAQARPVLHVVLTMVGKTVAQAARTLKTWVDAMRRGSKGFGPNHVRARPAYPIEYFAVLERHKDFERVGFHWHILIVGVDYLPHQHIASCLLSATKHTTREHTDVAQCRVSRVDKGHAIGYVTKYLLKDITREEKGVTKEEREMVELGLDSDGNIVERRRVVVHEKVSKARRIRYSEGFFPASVKEIRATLFGRAALSGDAEEDRQEETQEQQGEPEEGDQGEQQARLSGWALLEVEGTTSDREEYRQRRKEALEEVLRARDGTGKRLSRRVLTIWRYQQDQLRLAG